MNCKPGDLAYITSAYRDAAAVGHVVIVLERSAGDCFVDGVLYAKCDDSWLCGGSIPDGHERRILTQAVIGDAYLRPLRDPGDDARDEMLRPLPQEVTA